MSFWALRTSMLVAIVAGILATDQQLYSPGLSNARIGVDFSNAPPARQESQDSSDPVQFRGNSAHTGVSTARFFAGQGGIKWQTKTGDAVRSSPAVTERRVYAGSNDGNLYAFDRSTGAVLWKFAAGGPVSASAGVARGLVISATLDGRIFAVAENSGTLRWSMQTGPALPLNT